MSKYMSKPVVLNRSAEELFDHISDFSALQERIDKMPEEVKTKLGEVRFTDDTIELNAQPVGAIKFEVAERIRPSRIRLSGVQTPIPINIIVDLMEKTSDSTEITTTFDVDIPMMLRPLIGNKLQEAADKFSEMFHNFFGK